MVHRCGVPHLYSALVTLVFFKRSEKQREKESHMMMVVVAVGQFSLADTGLFFFMVCYAVMSFGHFFVFQPRGFLGGSMLFSPGRY